MQTVQFLPPERQKKLAWETEEIYAPLAYRLGMQKLSGELEDLSFPYTHPEEFKWLIKEVKDSYEDRLNYAIKILPIVRKMMEENNIKVISVDARAKRYSSLYKKLLRYNMDLEKIYDLVALRIIVESVEDCYAALGIIHKYWQPLPGQFDDYISRPKPNGYRSLHTTVFCIDNKITEFQIRTQEMHDEAELGIAAHWAYQQIKSSKKHAANWRGVAQRKELLWVEQLRNWQKAFTEQRGFIESLKIDFFKDRIFVITPENDVIDLPAGATPIDFAYRIHSDIGDSCVGAKVNGKIVTLDYELRSGDVVEIITQKGKKPSENWLRFVKTSLAQKQIKSALKRKEEKSSQKKIDLPPHMEFKIVNRDRPGYLKDITKVFAELKINITYLNSTTEERKMFSRVNIRCDILPEEKLKKLLVKLKAVAGTKEINYKFNRSSSSFGFSPSSF
jgi:GTP pyrophosphokinase